MRAKSKLWRNIIKGHIHKKKAPLGLANSAWQAQLGKLGLEKLGLEKLGLANYNNFILLQVQNRIQNPL